MAADPNRTAPPATPDSGAGAPAELALTQKEQADLVRHCILRYEEYAAAHPCPHPDTQATQWPDSVKDTTGLLSMRMASALSVVEEAKPHLRAHGALWQGLQEEAALLPHLHDSLVMVRNLIADLLARRAPPALVQDLAGPFATLQKNQRLRLIGIVNTATVLVFRSGTSPAEAIEVD